MKRYVMGGMMATALLLGGVSTAQQATAIEPVAVDRAALLAQIEQLMKVLATLQAQMQAIREEVDDLKAGLAEGMQDDDIRKVQELLASDPTLYPNAQVTGYFGPMTREALKRFQARYELEVTGRLDEPTREAIKVLRKERVNDRVPAGLLTSEAARARVRERLQEKWGDCDFTKPLREQTCKRSKERRKGDSISRDDDQSDDIDNSKAVSKKDVQKARLAIARAEVRLAALERVLDRRDYGQKITNIRVDKAQKRLREARLKLRLAVAALQNDPEKAKSLADDADDLIMEGAEAVDKKAVVDAVGEDESDDNESEDDSN